MFRQGLKSKILNLTIGLTLIGFGVLIFLVIKEEEKSLLRERLKASELMAQPILHTIYKDMLDERADMPRFLIEGLKTIKGVERVQLIRSNGVEEAFQDYKTLNAVKAEFGEIKPEWVVDHPNKLNNVARGIHNPDFKKALQGFNGGGKQAVYYIESEGDRSLFNYLVPIEYRPKCSSCHEHEEAARGALMITTSLDEMYRASGRFPEQVDILRHCHPERHDHTPGPAGLGPHNPPGRAHGRDAQGHSRRPGRPHEKARDKL